MKSLTRSISGQLILLIAGTVLLSQLLIMFIFFIRVDDRSDEYEDYFIIQQIAAVYQRAQSASGEKRQLLLEFSSSAEVLFSITPAPIGKSHFKLHFQDPDETQWFVKQLGAKEFYVSEKNPSFKDMWSFWFSDKMEECFSDTDQTRTLENCPYRVYSLYLNSNEWLNARIMPPPDAGVLLLPVMFDAFLMLLGITIAVIFTVRRITAPLRRLSEAASKLGRGEQIELLNTDGLQELSSTTQAFNLMHERLTRFIQDRTKMLAAISHDLRTPITSLRLNTEFIRDQELREKMIGILEDMQIIVEACLSFSRQEITEEKIKTIDLAQTLENLAEDSTHISFSSTIRTYDYSCRSVNIKRAIRNLLENAVKYGNKAHMSFAKNNEQIVITIQDQGQGIPEDRLEEMFEPFVRLDEARNTQSGSVGLGLSIARTIIHKHGGTIEAVNTWPGLKMIIQLPVQ